jgi:hypothetical protein
MARRRSSDGSRRQLPASRARGRPVETWLLALQRSAGNRAVAALLEASSFRPGTGLAAMVQRKDYGPEAGKGPEKWKAEVEAATSSAERAALVLLAVKPAVTVTDKTADCKSDTRVDPAHLVELAGSPPPVSYDDNLNAKEGRSEDAGYTKGTADKEFVVLGPKALDSDDFFWTRMVVSHEFDHVRQAAAKSKLTGNSSEVDAHTSSFIRDFHRSYIVGERGGTCYIQKYRTFSQLPGYYEASGVTKEVKADCVRRLTEYYKGTIKKHKTHDRVFRFWLYKNLKAERELAVALNKQLGDLVDSSKDPKDYRQFPCDDVDKASFPSPPDVAVP